jgi:YbbR domain-containing protein
VSLEGQPAAGYRLSSVRVNPSTVVLLGNADVLTAVPGFVETESIDLAGATSEIQQRLNLMVPEDVTILEGDAVDVTVSITAIEGGTTVRQEPVIQGTGAGMEATVALDTVEVILSGPLPLLESLSADDVFVILDLTGLLPGVHTVAPRVIVPDQIRSEGVIPQQVEVVITDNAEVGTPPAPVSTIPVLSPLSTPASGTPQTALPKIVAPDADTTPSPAVTTLPGTSSPATPTARATATVAATP